MVRHLADSGLAVALRAVGEDFTDSGDNLAAVEIINVALRDDFFFAVGKRCGFIVGVRRSR